LPPRHADDKAAALLLPPLSATRPAPVRPSLASRFACTLRIQSTPTIACRALSAYRDCNYPPYARRRRDALDVPCRRTHLHINSSARQFHARTPTDRQAPRAVRKSGRGCGTGRGRRRQPAQVSSISRHSLSSSGERPRALGARVPTGQAPIPPDAVKIFTLLFSALVARAWDTVNAFV
jgi:hypothetical protein